MDIGGVGKSVVVVDAALERGGVGGEMAERVAVCWAVVGGIGSSKRVGGGTRNV